MMMQNEARFETFTMLIAGINHNIRKLKTDVMSEFDLKSTHLYCLYHLYKGEELTAKELCERCSEDKAAVSRSIKYLEERGYIECKADSTKKYRKPLVLTEQGREVGEKIAERADFCLSFAGADLSDSDREVLYRGLYTVNEKLIELCDKYED